MYGTFRVERKLDKKPQDEDSCSQAMTVRGSTRSAALSGAGSGMRKNKKDLQYETGGLWWRILRQVLDHARATGHTKNTVSGGDEVSECESMDWEPTSVEEKKVPTVSKKAVRFGDIHSKIIPDHWKLMDRRGRNQGSVSFL